MKKKRKDFLSDFEKPEEELDPLNEEATPELDVPPQRPLTKEEKRIIRATKRKGVDRSKLDPYDQSDVAEAKRYAKKHKLRVIFVTLTIVLLLAIIASIVAVLVIQAQNAPSTANYRVSVGDDEPYEIKYKNANINGEFYFDLRSIANYAGLIVSGSSNRVKFTCADGTYVRLVNGESVATVNGEAVKVGGEAQIIASTDKSEGQCLVPFRFIEKLFSFKKDGRSVGMRVKINDENEVTIHKYSYDNGTDVPISFSADCFEYASEVHLSNSPSSNLDKETASALLMSRLTLVNKSNPMEKKDITTEGLISLASLNCPLATNLDGDNCNDFFEETAALALIAMLEEANKHLEGGEKILVSSAYRSFEYQEGLHEKYIERFLDENDVSYDEAKAEILLTSAPAGKSEHHTGLCVDLVEKDRQSYELDESFEDTPAFEWLSKNAHKYGFILRYPENKTDVTKYSYEPWHYRFVGLYAAEIIYEDGITLEEFLGNLN